MCEKYLYLILITLHKRRRARIRIVKIHMEKQCRMRRITKYIKKSIFQNHIQNKQIPYLKTWPVTGIVPTNGKTTYILLIQL